MGHPLPEAVAKAGDEGREPIWSWHLQNTDIVQHHPGITAPYSGPNSLSSASEVKETISLDLIFGLRLWPGAEFHLDGLMRQGSGFSDAHGIDGFLNCEPFRLGTDVPNGSINRADMGSYQAAVDSPIRPADIVATRDYRYKCGFGLNIQQEITKNIGVFSRLGWSDGNNEAWVFSDVDRTATLGLSVKGEFWRRPNDTVGLAGALNGISKAHQDFFAAGGLGILAGDGALAYGWEHVLETYYDFQLWKSVHATLDYQFVNHPAFNRDRGPGSVFGARLHWEF